MSEPQGSSIAEAGTTRDETRARIVDAAAALLASDGRDGVTTRAVATASGVQAPTIYRLFGDKRGLLDAVAGHGFGTYLSRKTVREQTDDPVHDLRLGWDIHIGFGLANPALFALMYGDPWPGVEWTAAVVAQRILRTHIRRIAAAGRLRLPEESATNLVLASGRGTVLELLAMPEDARDPSLSHVARDAVIAAITTDAPVLATPGPVAAAIALRAVLAETTVLSDGERALLDEWLGRLAS